MFGRNSRQPVMSFPQHCLSPSIMPAASNLEPKARMSLAQASHL
jgi:hypothetical protein